MSVYVGDNFTIEQSGRTYQVDIEFDDSHGAPWEESCGFVDVRRVSHDYGTSWGDSKTPGEFVFHRGERYDYSYCVDMPQALATARADEWGISEESRQRFADKYRRAPTKREIAMIAVNENIEFCRGWCANEWSFIGIVVTLLDDDEEETEYQESLWGVESCGDYARRDVVPELIGRIESTLQDEKDAADKESAESAYWASRDVVTVRG